MNSLGTGLAKASLAAGDRSRESPTTPTSFSTCAMITRWLLSTSRTCFISAANAFASACQLLSLSVERTCKLLPFWIWARGKRSCLVFTHAGVKSDCPFFQLPNHSQAMRRSFLLAFARAASAKRKSNLPSCGSTHAHAIGVNTVFR